jgi:hypothetical protein
LKDKVKILENEIQKLKNQNIEILKKTETSADKIKSLKDLKKELKALFSINGYSKILETKSPVKKVFWLGCMIIFIVFGLIIVRQNYESYQSHDVVTQIKNIDSNKMIFPAVTVCVIDFTQYPLSVSKNLSNFLVECRFEEMGSNKSCNLTDFVYFPLDGGMTVHNCFKYNGGRNASNILNSSEFGVFSGLKLRLNSIANESLIYYVGDNNVQPVFSDIQGAFKLTGKFTSVKIKKIVDIKRPRPYSNCSEDINRETSDLVKKILAQNVTYRQKNCYEQFKKEYQNISNLQEKRSELCPLECHSTTFEVLPIEMPFLEGAINLVNFYYSEGKYTEISQTVKTTTADFVSGNGGVLGLFLELSFLSAYRCIIFAYDIFVL